MAIISRIGSQSLKVRSLYFGMYAFLIIGAITMFYPFLLMISGSTKSAVDIRYFDAYPRFLHNDVWLYRKHVEGLFNDTVPFLNAAYDSEDVNFEKVLPPGLDDKVEALSKAEDELAEAAKERGEKYDKRDFDALVEEATESWVTEEHVNQRLADEALAFIEAAELPDYYYGIGYFETPVTRTVAMNLRGFKNWLREQYGKDIETVNAALGTEFAEWNWVFVGAEQYLQRREKPRANDFQQHLDAYKETVDQGLRYYFSAEGYYKKFYLKVLYGLDIEGYNTAHETDYASWDDVHLSRRVPENPKEREDWTGFVRDTIGLHFIRVDESATDMYQKYLQARHLKIENLNRLYETSYGSFSEIELIDEVPFDGMSATDWEEFIVGWNDPTSETMWQVPPEMLYLNTLETRYRDYLLETYGSVEQVNAALGTAYTQIEDAGFPQREMHFAYFVENRGPLKWEFVTRNYKTVAEYMLFHGRGIFNTVVYCTLAILSALLVNPLAAYAMSRYKMPSSYKILLFMLCTMAFPPMVTSIPNFLMLRHFGLLNTFAALILPGLANGYSIFLLKGFFDAQPQELYESAQLDGASEWVLFWQIAMSLSKPILAVIALQAFNMAYSNFMFAFVVCQDEKMWTLMVWLYQLQQRMGQPVMYASLIIAAIPTFLIFLFCQNIIMRGIVVPSEK